MLLPHTIHIRQNHRSEIWRDRCRNSDSRTKKYRVCNMDGSYFSEPSNRYSRRFLLRLAQSIQLISDVSSEKKSTDTIGKADFHVSFSQKFTAKQATSVFQQFANMTFKITTQFCTKFKIIRQIFRTFLYYLEHIITKNDIYIHSKYLVHPE